MDKPELEKVPAHCGCQGCYFDTHFGCELDEYIEEHGIKLPPPETWPCDDETTSYIFVPKEAEQ